MIADLTRQYDAYVDAYRTADGRLPAMMQLKRTHTALVVDNARLIADGESFSPEECETALVAALFHDVGRYEQLRLYNTFRDSESVDHAVFSHDILKREGWLEAARLPPERIEAVMQAVLYHNRRDLPPGFERPLAIADPRLRLAAIAAHTVRDADKLDIFRVLETQAERTDWRRDATAFWNLPVAGSPNPAVAGCIERGEQVDYGQIRTLSDFVLIQVGWMVSGLEFATTRRLCRERGHLDFRRRFLHQLSDSPSVDRICDLAAQNLV